MKSGIIFNIQRFSIHDGPGTRTTVFLKGCPMRCAWCSNPESQDPRPVLEVVSQNCIGCGACIAVCPQKALSFVNAQNTDGTIIRDIHGNPAREISVDRERCIGCGQCAKECYTNTLKFVGKPMTSKEAADEIAKDEPFYRRSGGGYTFSGGEPLMQADFCLDVIRECRERGMKANSCIETSGYGSEEQVIALARELDYIYYDVKHINPMAHRRWMGVSNELPLKNLHAIQDYAREITIRTPLVPGINDSRENIEETARLLLTLPKANAWELLPYHKLGEPKYEAIGMEYRLSHVEKPAKEHLKELIDLANEILIPQGKRCFANGTS